MMAEVRFADDQALLANSEEGLQKVIDRLDQTANKYNMRINIGKTKVMRISHLKNRTMKIIVEGKVLEVVQEFKYLGSIITNDGRCETDIRRRIARAKAKMVELENIWRDRDLSTALKLRIMKVLVWTKVN